MSESTENKPYPNIYQLAFIEKNINPQYVEFKLFDRLDNLIQTIPIDLHCFNIIEYHIKNNLDILKQIIEPKDEFDALINGRRLNHIKLIPYKYYKGIMKEDSTTYFITGNHSDLPEDKFSHWRTKHEKKAPFHLLIFSEIPANRNMDYYDTIDELISDMFDKFLRNTLAKDDLQTLDEIELEELNKLIIKRKEF